jgi:dihydroorotate dehydrogenase electron transfer subunit
MKDLVAEVVSRETAASGISRIELNLPEAIDALPGQFAHIAVPGAFLRRPISIAGCDARRVTLFVQDVGTGSAYLCSLTPGDKTRVLLPLGNPFPMAELLDIPRGGGKIWLVSGGIGAAPLLHAAGYIEKNALTADSFLGFRDEGRAFGVEDFRRCGRVELAIGGLVTDMVRNALSKSRPGAILACGPAPMLRALREICESHKIRAYASLEERMACGVGACLVCAAAIASAGSSEVAFKRVCRDGPVFGLDEVVFE